MNLFKAKRLSLSQANIYQNDAQPLCSIVWPAVRTWSCENSVIGDPYFQDKSLGSYPLLTVLGKTYTARRKILTNKFFGNNYEISLLDENDKTKISAISPSWIWKKTEIRFNDQTYYLIRKKFFQFYFILYRFEKEIGQLTDVTPFLTFSSKREFSLSLESPADLMLLSFSFFLAHNSVF